MIEIGKKPKKKGTKKEKLWKEISANSVVIGGKWGGGCGRGCIGE